MDAITAAATVGNKSQAVIDVLKAHFNPVLEDEVGQMRRQFKVVEQRLAAIEGQVWKPLRWLGACLDTNQ